MRRLFISLVVLICAGATLVAAEKTKTRVLVITGGHGFEAGPFFQVFADNPNISFTNAAHAKGASTAYERDDLLNYDCIVFYDMMQNISEAQKARLLAAADKGIGLLVMHHALVSFQAWPEFEQLVGGTYPEPANQRGKVTEELGYEHDVDVPVVIVNKEHTVTRGLNNFTINDEIYWGFRVSPKATPLITTTHLKSGKPLAWAHQYRNSRVVYLQLGHGPAAYGNPNYRKLVAQSIAWAAKRLK